MSKSRGVSASKDRVTGGSWAEGSKRRRVEMLKVRALESSKSREGSMVEKVRSVESLKHGVADGPKVRRIGGSKGGRVNGSKDRSVHRAEGSKGRSMEVSKGWRGRLSEGSKDGSVGGWKGLKCRRVHVWKGRRFQGYTVRRLSASGDRRVKGPKVDGPKCRKVRALESSKDRGGSMVEKTQSVGSLKHGVADGARGRWVRRIESLKSK